MSIFQGLRHPDVTSGPSHIFVYMPEVNSNFDLPPSLSIFASKSNPRLNQHDRKKDPHHPHRRQILPL